MSSRRTRPSWTDIVAADPPADAPGLDTFRQEEQAPSDRQNLVPALTILYHADLARIGEQVLLHDLAAGVPCPLSRATPAFTSRQGGEPRPLADRNLSRGPLLFLPLSHGGIRIDPAECRSRMSVRGVAVTCPLDVSPEDMDRGIPIELASRAVLLLHRATSSNADDALGKDAATASILGESAAVRRLREDIRRVADLDLSVLVRGETGSGKELVAQAIHRASGRHDKPFVAVNLAAVPPSLAVAELFGAERGAFTGAIRTQQGYFQKAEGGTLFLDEIGEAPVELQVALLRALETGEIQPVGAQRPVATDVRILAATDADLEEKVATGSFRAPLLHRLSAFEVWLPPLRERREDIGRLLVQFLSEELERIGEAQRLESPPTGEPWLPASIVARLVDHGWPGNVRQFRNVVRQIVVGSRGASRIQLPPAVERMLAAPASRPSAPAPAPASPRPSTFPPPSALPSAPAVPRRKPSDVSEDELAEALRVCRWDLAAASSQLGVSRPSLYALIEQSERLRTAGDLGSQEITSAFHACQGDLARMVERLQVSERALRRRLRDLGLDPDAGAKGRRGGAAPRTGSPGRA
jgi:DNA-binding NtrC family response regulator